MPELPEVETVRKGLVRLMKGQKIHRITLNRKNLRTPFPPGMEKALEGRRVEDVDRRAKYLLIRLSGNKTLLAHLGMSGRMAAESADKPIGKHDHVLIDLSNGRRLVFRDPRRFGLMDVVATDKAPKHKLLRHIGPEPFSKEFTPEYLEKKFKGRKVAVKVALMDQRLIAGIGNIYASEALYYAGIDPRRPAGKVTRAEFQKLVPAIRKVLEKSIRAGGSSLRDYAHADGRLGSFQHEFAVYGKEARGIKCITLGGRSTYFDPVKQK